MYTNFAICNFFWSYILQFIVLDSVLLPPPNHYYSYWSIAAKHFCLYMAHKSFAFIYSFIHTTNAFSKFVKGMGILMLLFTMILESSWYSLCRVHKTSYRIIQSFLLFLVIDSTAPVKCQSKSLDAQYASVFAHNLYTSSHILKAISRSFLIFDTI
jgi:Kef-type K+ transport system membrane component KefB